MQRSTLFSVALSAILVVLLSGCNGTATSLTFPSQAPWAQMATGILSPTDDLVAVSSGAGIEAELQPGNPEGVEAIVACNANGSPYLEYCAERSCDPQAACGAGVTVIEKRYASMLGVRLDRSVFTSGSIQLVNGAGETVLGLAINSGGTGGFDVAAGLSEGLIPGVQLSEADELGTLILAPHWPDYGSGAITGKICTDGVCGDGNVAFCEADSAFDRLSFSTVAQSGTYSGTCGAVPVRLTINPKYSSVGSCISQRQALCSRLTGQNRKTCNHAQIGVCHAAFHVPSAHNR